MRGPQFMLIYWKELQATATALRDGWYWSGDLVTATPTIFSTCDRLKEMIKYRVSHSTRRNRSGFVRTSAVRECAVAEDQTHLPRNSRSLSPCATIHRLAKEKSDLCNFVSERLTGYSPAKSILSTPSPKPPSGKPAESCGSNNLQQTIPQRSDFR
jgi:long-chain acyl-CoA synthetase